MGFALERFAEAVDPAFTCGLCGQVLDEPVCAPCGHVYCASCLLPWAAQRRRCPLQCQPLAPGELRPVLPLRSLIQQLRVQCDYRARGCGHTVRLRELAAHVERCAFRLASRGGRRRGRSAGAGDGGAARGAGVRGLAWGRREKALAAQLWALRSEVQLTARKYQEKLTQYMAHIRSLARDPGGGLGRVSADREGWGAVAGPSLCWHFGEVASCFTPDPSPKCGSTAGLTRRPCPSHLRIGKS